METAQSATWPATNTTPMNSRGSKGLISALEATISLYERLTSLAPDPQIMRELQALEAEKKVELARLRTPANRPMILEVTLSALLWQQFDNVAASVADAGQFLTEAEALAFAMSAEEALWQAYVQVSLLVEDRRAKLLATQLLEQQAQSVRGVAARIRHMEAEVVGHSVS